MKKIYFLPIILIISFCLTTCSSDESNDNVLFSIDEPDIVEFDGSNPSADSSAIDSVISIFSSNVRSKSRIDLQGVMHFTAVPLTVVNKTNSGPSMVYNSSQGWIDEIIAQPFETRLDIINRNIRVIGQMGISVARFDQFVDGAFLAYGTDLFLYIKKSNGWKIASMNVTVVGINDTTDYSIPYMFNNTIEDIYSSYSSFVSQKDASRYLTLFHRAFAPIIGTRKNLYFDNIISLEDNQKANGFIAEIVSSAAQIEINLSNRQIVIQDQYLAYLICDYTRTEDGNVVQTGQQMWTLTASVNLDWGITSILYVYK